MLQYKEKDEKEPKKGTAGKPMIPREFCANELKMMYLFSKVNKLVQHLPGVVNNQAGEKRWDEQKGWKPTGSNKTGAPERILMPINRAKAGKEQLLSPNVSLTATRKAWEEELLKEPPLKGKGVKTVKIGKTILRELLWYKVLEEAKRREAKHLLLRSRVGKS